MKKTNYETLYRRNNETGSVIIDIALENYLEFFNEWDNSPIRKRDIHPELTQFFDECSEDIPISKKIEIVFSINTDVIITEKEEQIRVSYRNYYNSLQRLVKRKTERFFKVSAILLFTSLVLLSAYALLSSISKHTIVAEVLLESLLIGGWVFTWEAVHLLFLDIIEPFRRRREIKRFLETELKFKYVRAN
ncbi:MAG: hypothetical protein BWY74_02658 [Firmicutes bacterium ADurb.Bin419]|nr:MAG: hypothetical protein BWY74_02658 [Firmicutes bacterium ADurb.Bin419]